eukprot:352421-Chlamydomonas_euryale.AAC.39
MDHLDVGIWAFRRFADPGKGVVGIEYRPISCPDNYKDNGCSHPHDPACKGSFAGTPADTSGSQDTAGDSGDGGNTASPYADDTYGQDSSGEGADTANSSGDSYDSSDGSGQDNSYNSGETTYESGQDGSGQDGKYYDDNSDNQNGQGNSAPSQDSTDDSGQYSNDESGYYGGTSSQDAYGDSTQQEYSSGGDSGTRRCLLVSSLQARVSLSSRSLFKISDQFSFSEVHRMTLKTRTLPVRAGMAIEASKKQRWTFHTVSNEAWTA